MYFGESKILSSCKKPKSGFFSRLLCAILLGNTALPINLGLDVAHHRYILYLFSDLVVAYIQGQALGLAVRLPKSKLKKNTDFVKHDIKILRHVPFSRNLPMSGILEF